MKNKPRIAIVGHGHWGKNIARNLYEMGMLVGVYDTHPDQQKAAADRYADVLVYRGLEELLADQAIDAVIVSTPAATHVELGLKVVRAGKDAFVEKPLALTVAEGEYLVQEAAENGRVLMVGHLLEYHPAVLKLEELVRSGDLGTLQYLYSNRLNLGRFRREENILWSFAPHDIAVILRLMDEDPIEIIATAGVYLQPNVADITVTNMLFENGVRAHIFVSWLHPTKVHRFVAIGSSKMVVFDDGEPHDRKLILYDKGADWVNDEPVPRQGNGVPVPFDPSEPLRLELEHFVDCVQTRRDPLTNGQNGLRVLRVLQAAQQSMEAGGDRVSLLEPIAAD